MRGFIAQRPVEAEGRNELERRVVRRLNNGVTMKTKLERLALEQISALAHEAQDVVLQNNENMGIYSHRESGFGKLNEKLRQIERWATALSSGYGVDGAFKVKPNGLVE